MRLSRTLYRPSMRWMRSEFKDITKNNPSTQIKLPFSSLFALPDHQFGYANISLDCSPCDCDEIGSLEKFCDTDTGQCPCKIGVTGIRCDQCQDEYFNLSADGCYGKCWRNDELLIFRSASNFFIADKRKKKLWILSFSLIFRTILAKQSETFVFVFSYFLSLKRVTCIATG